MKDVSIQNKAHLSLSQLLLSCVLLLAVTSALCLIFTRRTGEDPFAAFCAELYRQEMTANTLNLHYGLAHPELFGITEYPVTLEDLKNIQGVGEGKMKQPYAKEFVDLIKRYCEENNITRQADLRVRTVAKKSLLKVKIIQNIDRQIALDDIANAQNIDFDELLDEVEAIVYSGTKLNIDYFLDEVMDEERVDEIYDYFADSDTDDLETAIQELGGDEDEIRLVRIKFISEMAN